MCNAHRLDRQATFHFFFGHVAAGILAFTVSSARELSPQPHATEAITIRSPKDVYDCLAEMRTLRKEQLCGLYLNVRNRVIHKETVSIGTITANLVDPKVVLLPAVEHCAVGVIIAHNHPSGNPEPSDEDIAITTQAKLR
mgnify:CR=1 FL=1